MTDATTLTTVLIVDDRIDDGDVAKSLAKSWLQIVDKSPPRPTP